MGTDDHKTLKDLSEELGTTMVDEVVSGGAFSKGPARVDRREHPLMHPHQLREALDPERGQFIVTRAGKPPIIVGYGPNDRTLPVWKYDPDPGYRETFLRALTRKVVNWFVAFPAPRGPRAQVRRS
jgi:hypothetical protein